MAVAKSCSANFFPADWTRLDRLVAVSVFPVLISGALLAGYSMMQRGLSAAEVVTPCVLGTYLLIAGLERFFPHHRSWGKSRGDLRVDLGWAFTNGLVNSLAEPLALAGAVYLAGWLSVDFGGGLWPQAWPLPLQLALALLIGEFIEYWAHRLMHEVDWLWRFHAVHHSAPRLYFLNAARFHPIDLFVVGTCRLLPMAFLGATPQLLALVTIFAAVHGAFQHSNLKLKLGPLNWVFSMAELHRWHHSPLTAESNFNYGGNLIFWDIVFGTRWLPENREPPEAIGMESLPEFPQGFWWQLASPFAWKHVVARSGALGSQEPQRRRKTG